jgi:hypothetical protein
VFERDFTSGPSLSVAHDRKRRGGKGCLIPFFGLFFLVGAGMFYWMTVRPMLGILAARSWVETPCTIVSSEVEVHRGDGDTYSIAIRYDYIFAGRQYHGDRYHFMGKFSSSGRAGKQAAVDQYPAGAQAVCYVDPDDPSEAVLNRGLTADMWWGLFPLPFLLVGTFGLLFTTGILGKKKADASGLPALSGDQSTAGGDDAYDAWSAEDDAEPDGPVTLKPKYSPLAKFLGIVAIALFWNGITSVFVYQAVKSFQRGQPEWCLTIFITPFVLVGLLLIVGIFHSFLALFNPRPTLTLSWARIPLGGTAKLSWTFAGNPHAIRLLRVTLRGEESCTYRQGTKTHTDKHHFLKEVLFETHDPLEIPEGEVEIRIPANTMHSFTADNNKIVWEIHLDGEIPLRPDVDAEFPITVTPHEQYAH